MQNSWYTRLLSLREKYITQSQFILVLSFVTGVLAALAAFLLKTTIHFIQHLLTNQFSEFHVNYLYLIFPVIGISLTLLFVKKVVRDDISHGVTRILYAISQRKSIIKLHNIWTSLVGSSITIGFGGSVGAEAPIVLTGSAIGSNLGKFFKLDQKTLMLLVGCGAAGAIGGIFKAPIAGLVFTIEVLMLDMTFASIVPLIISSVTATACAYILSGSSFMFAFSSLDEFTVQRIPYLILLGIVCGFVSLYFTRGMNKIESFFRHQKNSFVKLAVGGSMLSLLIFLFPPLYGEGYNTIDSLLTGQSENLLSGSLFLGFGDSPWVLILYLLLIIIFKIFASAATNGAGGVGGIFAPSLFVGAITGYAVAELLKMAGIIVPHGNFVLAGMSGLMSGVMHAPLTGIFLIAELTGGYNLFMTLMIVSVVSYITIRIFEPHSLYAMRLAQRGELITHNKDRAVLSLLDIENVIETDLTILSPDVNLGQIVKIFSKSRRNIYPVVDSKSGVLLGVILLDELRNIMFRPEFYNRFTAEKLMIMPQAKITQGMSMENVMKTFEDTGAWNLPVVDDEQRYVGYISKSNIFTLYRELLVQYSDE